VGEAWQATSSTYDRIAAVYAERATVTPALRAHLGRFIAAVASRGMVLDAGSGPGQLAAVLAQQGLRTLALDSSHEMLRLAGDRVPVIRGDLRRLPVADESLHGIWSCASLLHVPRNEVPATLRSWRAALRAEGVLGLSTAAGADDEEGWEVVPYADETQPHETPMRRWFVYHSADQLQAMLEEAGFDVLEFDTRESHRTWLQIIASCR